MNKLENAAINTVLFTNLLMSQLAEILKPIIMPLLSAEQGIDYECFIMSARMMFSDKGMIPKEVKPRMATFGYLMWGVILFTSIAVG